MESSPHDVQPIGPAALLQRHKLARATRASPPLILSDGEKCSGQQLHTFESHLEAIREKLDSCLKGIADNENSLNALSQHVLIGAAKADSLGGVSLCMLPVSAPPPHSCASRYVPPPLESIADGNRLSNSISSTSLRDSKVLDSSEGADPASSKDNDIRTRDSMRQRRANSGNNNRTVVDLSLMKSRNLTLLSDGAVSAQPSKQRERSKFAVELWRMLDEPASSRMAIWINRAGASIILVSIMLTLIDSGAEQTLGVESDIIQLCCDSMFSIEFLVRFYCCPSRRVFLSEKFSWLEICSSFPVLAIRVVGGLEGPLDVNTWPYLVLIAFTPVLRLLLMLRRFEQIHLQLSAFRSAAAALPVLVYTLSTLIVFFGALLFVVEPRDNIHSFAEALWVTIVTSFTVGYGDKYPTSPAGRCVVCGLMFVSALYMAIPIGIVGDAFSRVWAERDSLLLVRRMSMRLRFAHINAHDIPALFHRFDVDQNGMIDRAEFLSIIQSMRVNLDDAQAIQLFSIIDADGSGEITDEEFVKVLFPSDFEEMYDALTSVVDITKQVATSVLSSPQQVITLGSDTAHRMRASVMHMPVFHEEVLSPSMEFLRGRRSSRHSGESPSEVE